jgi:hypothetical protein
MAKSKEVVLWTGNRFSYTPHFELWEPSRGNQPPTLDGFVDVVKTPYFTIKGHPILPNKALIISNEFTSSGTVDKNSYGHIYIYFNLFEALNKELNKINQPDIQTGFKMRVGDFTRWLETITLTNCKFGPATFKFQKRGNKWFVEAL